MDRVLRDIVKYRLRLLLTDMLLTLDPGALCDQPEYKMSDTLRFLQRRVDFDQ